MSIISIYGYIFKVLLAKCILLIIAEYKRYSESRINMKLVFIRHGDPDYTIDSLTERGWEEAKLLSKKMKNFKADEIYVSPLGRAQDTANVSLKEMGREAVTLDWLKEFDSHIVRPDRPDTITSPAWDWLPQDFAGHEDFFHPDTWTNHPAYDASTVKEDAYYIYKNFEVFLNEHGYEKDGRYFRATKPNNDTIVFFCHFGITCVLLGYLLNISPFALWHGTCAAPTSMTTVVTEERREGIAYFRMSAFGDTSHLYAGNMEPAFAARFCECYANTDERHD